MTKVGLCDLSRVGPLAIDAVALSGESFHQSPENKNEWRELFCNFVYSHGLCRIRKYYR